MSDDDPKVIVMRKYRDKASELDIAFIRLLMMSGMSMATALHHLIDHHRDWQQFFRDALPRKTGRAGVDPFD